MQRSFELRLMKMWNAPAPNLDKASSEKQPMWVITSIFPELNQEGEVIEIIGCCTDIRYASSSRCYMDANIYQVNKNGARSFRPLRLQELKSPKGKSLSSNDTHGFTNASQELGKFH